MGGGGGGGEGSDYIAANSHGSISHDILNGNDLSDGLLRC